MSLPVLALAVVVLLAVGYRFYGGFIARQYAIDPNAPTPAQSKNDGVEFVPTKPFYLLGQHFSAIAAAGPIAGPIIAAQQFGWLPSLLWIALGVVLIGAVHDFSTLVASVRHDARSIAEVIRLNLGPGAGLAILAFIWIALVYVIVAFTDVTAATFVSGDADLQGLTFTFNPGGAVAFASTLYLVLSVVMGLVDRFLKPPLWLQTIIFVPATLGVVWLGTCYSTVFILHTEAWGLSAPKVWSILILAYCFVASLTPMWALLQPRGYLGGFILYIAIAVGVVGLFFGGFDIQLPVFKGWSAPNGDLLFPFLFVTIACGACSGFHGLVCSGTTSRQIANEAHCKPVGYGAMLLEGFVALIALGTVMIAAPAVLQGKAPGAIYGAGLGRFMAVIIGEKNLLFATTFGAMAFSTFVFDTLDVSTRLGRYILQELFGATSTVAAAIATAVTVLVPLTFVLAADAGAWKYFWTLFGTSNQLLASLSLMGISVWLKRSGRRYWYALYPMVFVTAVTVTSLLLQIHGAFFKGTATTVQQINGVVCVVLLALAGAVAYFCVRALLAPSPPVKPGSAAPAAAA
ncbi:MAG: carbon starvation protein A [Myxococcaceae bacterium]|nr:carbon starvation protein A [Myxococcaceae bacterium]